MAPHYPEDDTPSLDELKRTLPVTYIMHVRGEEPADTSGTDILYASPFRLDTNPSIACYTSDDSPVVDRWRDMAGTDGGDIFDLIAAFEARDGRPSNFPACLGVAVKLHSRLAGRDGDWVGPSPAQRVGTLDMDSVRAEIAQYDLSWSNEDPRIDQWLDSRQDNLQHMTAAWLHDTFGVVWGRACMHFPYKDRDGNVVVAKYRVPGEKTESLPGSRGMYTTLYGEHLDQDLSRPVVLCEGESDVWSGTHATQDYCFLGLPSGAGYSEKLLPRLAGRRVLIALDGDDAGRGNAVRWADGLSSDNDVEIVPVPDGKDLSTVADIPSLLSQSRPYITQMPGLIQQGGRYFVATRDGSPGRQVSDFTLEPVRVMFSTEGGLSYEVRFGARSALLTSQELGTKNAFKSWAHRHGLNWAGSDTDTVVLSSRLAVSSLFVPTESASDIVGLFENHIVWDGGSIGDREVRYVPGATKVNLDIRLSEEDFDADVLHDMRDMNDRSVVDPIMAWAAAAPFRSLLAQFPVLNVSGVSGSGKTTTVQAIIPALTGSHVFQTLSSSTPYAVESIIHTTNAFPVVFDEYRPGARSTSIDRLDQLARDAYDGQPSAKSKGGDSWNQIAYIRTMAPIVISGEQSVDETSHVERMITVQVRKPLRRPESQLTALRTVQALTAKGGLAHAYMRYVVREVRQRPLLYVQPTGPDTLPDRIRYNLGVLEFGWRCLNDFLRERGEFPLDDPDWSAIVDTVTEASATNPTVEALDWALGDVNASRNVWVDSDWLYVNVPGFVSDVNRNGVFTLPGDNARTISELLRAEYGAASGTRVHPHEVTYKRVWMMPVESVWPDGREVD